MDIQVVRKLEDIAFDATYKTIMGNLILCHEHRPEGKELPWLPYSSILSTNLCLSSENVCNLVRHHLDQKLVGTMGEKVRGQYVKRFYEDLVDCGKACTLVDIWVFLHCILDANIKELDIHGTFPDSELSPQLIPTIAKWTPLLTDLEINFELMKRAKDDTEKLKSMIKSLSSLVHLKHLSLFGLKPKERYCALSLIGKSCPSLTYLAINAASMDKNDILALILGELANILLLSEEKSAWYEDVALHDLVVPSELRTPVCSTLREFLIVGRYVHNEDNCCISKAVAAFALRNLPLLQKMSVRIPTSLAVQLLYDTDESKISNTFVKACQEAVQLDEDISISQPLLRSSLPGRLSLRRLSFVNVRSDRMLMAVGERCPLLEAASFCAQSFLNERDYYEDLEIVPESIASPEDVAIILKKWPKLSKLKLIGLSPEYVKPILDVFGPHLRHLELKDCSMIKLTDLAICFQLEDLQLRYNSSLDPEEHASAFIDDDTFLPKLKSFLSSRCLGVYSGVFEKKPNLVHLDMMCLHHVGIEARLKEKRFGPSAVEVCGGQPDWCRIPQLWSRLETLVVRQYAGFSMDMISDLIRQLHNLKMVVLPQRISSYDSALFASLKNHLSNRTIPAEILFFDFIKEFNCPVV